MKLKIFYHQGTDWTWIPTRLASEKDLLALSFNNWNDYGVATTLNAVLYVEKKAILKFTIKMLIEGNSNSPKRLNDLREDGWDGYFPIPGENYITVPSDIEFYDALISKLGLHGAAEVLRDIRDAGYLANILKDEAAQVFMQDSNFETSPLREAGARKAFADGWRAFTDLRSNIKDFVLYSPNRETGSPDPIEFRFNSKVMPYDINVLIGPNGIGKSFTLKILVEYWLGIETGSKSDLLISKRKTFDSSPNIAKLILISYSPFEEFEIDLSKSSLNDKDAYKYFGFRKQTVSTTGHRRIGISRNLPATDSIESVLKAFLDDQNFAYLNNWTSKVETIWDVLQPAIGFDFVALEINPSLEMTPALKKHLITDETRKNYLHLSARSFKRINKAFEISPAQFKTSSGVVFLKGQKRIELSSGQRLFCYMVINIVGQIKTDSLVIVDEPELFLHPSLEIEFISLLKKVLKAFNSKAILATHSLAIAREIPANCMHVYKKEKSGVEIDNPPFETFGADMQRISSYVFADNRVEKPSDEWIEAKLKEFGDPTALIRSMKGEINEEVTIKILNSRITNGR